MSNTSNKIPECRKCGADKEFFHMTADEIRVRFFRQDRFPRPTSEGFTLMTVCVNKECDHFGLLNIFA